MKSFLESFFKNIVQFEDTTVQELDKNLYRCTSKSLADYQHQAKYLESLLMGYGLNNVLKFEVHNGEAELTIDFGSRHHEKIQENSQKFLTDVRTYWWDSKLDAYASLVDDHGAWTNHAKFAGQFLLGFNFSQEPKRFFCATVEATPNGRIVFTFDEPNSPTVLYATEDDLRIASNGKNSNYFYRLTRKALLAAFLGQRDPRWELEVNAEVGAISAGDFHYTLDDLTRILEPNRVVALASNKRAQLIQIKQILVEAIK
jgi:hypothetical protein